ncbi:TRAP transporter small permease [Billgrantia tianxiuensis]|jgi:TRAP-type C4-dicarboxylate transport system permease small subunit|uniref:TRAP transporter small permease protein n=1 Tax=Billgrantia tianxiuensis TaxID=2497861 RepID=A0A6I6SLA4_9GAMM|nr:MULTISPECIES: TRAP transporter small permease [Halomonas]MCE8032717.1 TRAP transporter small permease [Halomonas sp. MCCC 1A11057]QHC49376.1 TRAP transporter small permease [Halomonas tianxiuensis]
MDISPQRSEDVPDGEQVMASLDALSAVPRLQGPLGRVIGWVDRLFVLLANLALVGIAVTVLLQISGRLFLPFTLSWTEELSRYLFIYMVALAAGVAIRRHRHVNVELFHHRLGLRTRAAYQALICLLVGGFALMALPAAWQFAQNGAWQTSPTLRVPMLYIFFSTVLLFGLVLFYSAVGLVEGLAAAWRPPVDGDREEASWK